MRTAAQTPLLFFSRKKGVVHVKRWFTSGTWNKEELYNIYVVTAHV